MRQRTLFLTVLLVICLTLGAVFLLRPSPPAAFSPSGPTFGAQSTVLPNGLQVVVIPNPRVPVVTHMMWIKAGAATEPPGKSGIAHFLEHLMFKGTPSQEPGSYSRTVARLGGQDNAFTSWDYTAYFFTIPRDKLTDVMALEADRLQNLQPPPTDVLSERLVIREERRQRVENNPLTPYTETLAHMLFPNHPYGRPIIGWGAEMAALTWEDAKAFYDTWYAPNNAILILSGDITPDEAYRLARTHYGSWRKRDIPTLPPLTIPALPGQMRLLAVNQDLHNDTLALQWRVPSYRQDYQAALALDIMVNLLDGGLSTHLYQSLVVQQKKAVSVSLSYDGSSRDDAVLALTATPAPGVTLTTLEQAIIDTLNALAAAPITADDLQLAKQRLVQNNVFARDSVSGPAMIIGAGLSTGLTLDQIENWHNAINKVTLAAVEGQMKQRFAANHWYDTPPATILISAPGNTP